MIKIYVLVLCWSRTTEKKTTNITILFNHNIHLAKK